MRAAVVAKPFSNFSQEKAKLLGFVLLTKPKEKVKLKSPYSKYAPGNALTSTSLETHSGVFLSQDMRDELGMIEKLTDKHQAELRNIERKYNVLNFFL